MPINSPEDICLDWMRLPQTVVLGYQSLEKPLFPTITHAHTEKN